MPSERICRQAQTPNSQALDQNATGPWTALAMVRSLMHTFFSWAATVKAWTDVSPKAGARAHTALTQVHGSPLIGMLKTS
mmetsp:Transcript_50028/g.86926  ORF Transcript_50028/g.86926 Transcript_50028/m.86926 type:complete len:80 (+) Transcript_50028:104-343(+)